MNLNASTITAATMTANVSSLPLATSLVATVKKVKSSIVRIVRAWRKQSVNLVEAVLNKIHGLVSVLIALKAKCNVQTKVYSIKTNARALGPIKKE